MSELTNRAAYLKGLAEGMKLDKETNEGRLLSEIIDFLNDAAAEINAIDNEQGFIADKIDDMDEKIEVIGNEVFDEFYDDDYDDDDNEFSIRCQECGEDICVTDDDLMEGEVVCPNCGTEIEFDFDCNDDCDDDCDCE